MMGKKLKTAMIFGDHMVLQRQKPIRIWGTCTEGNVTVSLAGRETAAECTDGTWEAVLPPMEACEGLELVVLSGDETLRFADVAVGEVWLAAGQSNMEFYLRYDSERKDAEENPKIRMFDYPEVAFEGQLEQGDYSDYGFWRVCESENLDYFSAAAYYFAMQIQKQYQVPVGIVGCSWGATPACAWMDPAYLEDNEGKVWLEDYQKVLDELDLKTYEKEYQSNPEYFRQKPFENELNEAMMYGVSSEELGRIIQEMLSRGESIFQTEGPKSEKRPGGLYESMVKKIAPYSVRGVLWYQGENDEKHADVYYTVLSRLIRCWRELWGEKLPFCIVQLAPFRYWDQDNKDRYPSLRRAQERVSREVPAVWMASIMDEGLETDIHPKRKRPVGERLALLARGHVYGEEILCDPPECRRLTLEDGRLSLAFDNAGEGLKVTGERVEALEITCDGKELEDYGTRVEKDSLIIESTEIKKEKKVCVRFAETDFCIVNMYSSIGLPAKPFTKYS